MFGDSRSMFGRVLSTLVAGALLALASAPGFAQGTCTNCDLPPGCRGVGQGGKTECTVVLLTVESDVDFGRLILVGGQVGHVAIDLASGAKLVFGDLEDGGGIPVYGTALVTGQPLRNILVTMPASVTLTDPSGAQGVMRDFQTNLSALPRLDANGQLRFNFTGTLYTDAAIRAGGTLRGRVPITVDYN